MTSVSLVFGLQYTSEYNRQVLTSHPFIMVVWGTGKESFSTMTFFFYFTYWGKNWMTSVFMGMAARLVISLWLLLLSGLPAAAQGEAFDLEYDRIWKKVAPTDLNTAITKADSLYRAASLPVHRMRCMMLMARFYQQKEDLEKSIDYAEKIEQLAVESGDYAWQARANGYLAGLYRMMELYNKARSYSEKALEIIPKIKDQEQANSTRGLMLQELAFASKDEEKYEQAIRYLNEAGKSFGKIQKNRELNLLNNERLIGDSYRLLARYDSAIVHYHKALKFSSGWPLDYTTGLACKGMAEALMERGSLADAKIYLDKAEYIADKSQYLQLKDATYDLSKKYYALVNNRKKVLEAGEKSNAVTDTLLDKRAKLLNKMYTQLDQLGSKESAEDSRKGTVIVVILILLFFSGVSLVIYGKRRAAASTEAAGDLNFFGGKEIVDQIASDSNRNALTGPFTEIEDAGEEIYVKENTEKRLMPPETEKILLEKLVDFEKSNAFLSIGFSLALLASQLGTNTKYLSYLIRKHKGTDFNNYINNLRVDFVIEVLKREPNWRQHKISVIAAESGFSSSSLFAAVFKTRTGYSPSVFIKEIAKDAGSSSCDS